MGGLQPEAAVIVATVRSLKLHGGADKKNLGQENLAALERGLANLEKHRRFWHPPQADSDVRSL